MRDCNCDYSDRIIGKWKLIESVLHMNNNRYVVTVKSDNFFVEFYLSGKAYWHAMEFSYALNGSSIFCGEANDGPPEMEIITLNEKTLVLKVPAGNTLTGNSFYLEHFVRDVAL